MLTFEHLESSSTQRLLGCVCKIRKEDDRGDSDHGGEIGGSFLVAGSNSAELF